jgi:hypothetical protein
MVTKKRKYNTKKDALHGEQNEQQKENVITTTSKKTKPMMNTLMYWMM